METKVAGATGMHLYENFEPYCKWITDQTIEIDLKGFKKEHLKARTNRGILTILGERPLDTTNNKWRRFRKEFRLSKDYNVNEIRAKFSGGVLPIVMPKKENRKVIEKKHSIWGVKIRKGTAVKVAIVVLIVVVASAIGTQIAHFVNRHHPHHHDTADKDKAVNV